jgi:tetratricopeptide (TPR) repeat protein
MVYYCPDCGSTLTGTEKYCPECGQDISQQKRAKQENNNNPVNTSDIKEGDVISGKEVGYTVQGNVINLHFSGGTSKETIAALQKIIATPTRIDDTTIENREDIKTNMEESERHIQSVLDEITSIQEKEGKHIDEIKAGGLHISTNELSLKDIAVKGYKYWYENQYLKAIEMYDRAIKINSNIPDFLINKGLALYKLEKYEEAINNYDTALKLEPRGSDIWYYKGLCLDELGEYNKAIECYNKAKEIDPTYAERLLTMGDVKIITDEPMSKGVLDFNKYSKLLANTIQSSNPRFTVGIFGEWGTGKTTLMLMIQKILDKNDKVVTVWFDAWRYEREENLAVIPFLRTVKLRLDDLEKSKLGNWGIVKKGVIRTAAAFLTSTKVTYGIKSGPSVEMDFGKVADSLKGDGSIDNDKDNVYYHVTDFLERSLRILRKEDREYRIVIFLDDLDRCTPERAFEVLESIKSFFDLEGIVYVVGMNYNSINNLVKEKYGEKVVGITGFDYMKKIVQLPFQIPDWIEIDISKFIDNIISKNLQGSVLAKYFSDNKLLLMKAVEWNPREVKRFVNNIILSKALFDKPVNNLVVVQALKFRPEWKRFLDFLMPLERRRAFLTAYSENRIKNSDHVSIYHDKSKDETTKNELLDVYPNFFKQNDSLRDFLDAGACEVLLKIENMEEYRRALDRVELRVHMLQEREKTNL